MQQQEAPLALVFGGSRGIGRASVEALSAAGWRVAWTYVAAEPEGERHAWRVDVRDPAQVAAAFDAVERAFSAAPDAVVANAGINVPGAPLTQFDPTSFQELMDVNLTGAFHVLAEAARRVRDGGAIVAITTSLVRYPLPGAGPYAASKAAVEALLRSLARELAPRCVRVNGVAPGPVDTDLFSAGKTEEAKRRMAGFSPFNRIGTPSEVAEVVRFLLSREASWIHGQMVQPNGGMA